MLSPERLRALAEVGARQQIAELMAEIDRLQQAFPQLIRASAKARLYKAAAIMQAELPPDLPPRRGPKPGTMSAKARAAMSKRMKQRWASAKANGQTGLEPKHSRQGRPATAK